MSRVPADSTKSADSTTPAYACPHCETRVATDNNLSSEIAPQWESIEGVPRPLGATWIIPEQAWNFAIYSRHANRVTLVLFGDDVFDPVLSIDLDPLANKSGPVWHCRVKRSACPHALYYAWRMDGPAPQSGYEWHAFDYEKLLLDPYAKSVYFPPEFRRQAAIQSGSNLGRAPLGLLKTCNCSHQCHSGGRIRHGSDLVIYELHVRGFTRHASSGLDAEKRGTFAAVIDKIPYLVELGVTAVELMPIFQFDPDEGKYWGYMPLNFFSPHHLYSTDPDHCVQRREFREMVQKLHEANIEVILDVVYNHTCEEDQRGPTYGFKGIDNSTYYMVTCDPQQPYANFSGTGNTLHTANRATRQLVVDSLRYWVSEMGVDGFRFDLASVFTRNSDGTINPDDPPIFAQIAGDPVLSSIRMIAEPWDAGGAYQLGRGFPGVLWMQWNALYHQTIQRFVRGDRGMIPELMSRIYGSCDLFPDHPPESFRPFQSLNYVSSHDGMTMNDLVSFNEKCNWANGHNNTDGPLDFSWNCGWEGNESVPAVVMSFRKQQIRNFFCLLLLSGGTPMFRMGDEFMHTQGGNSNPYNQDNETTWLDWRRLEEHRDLFEFVRQMIVFRKSHPTIARSQFWRDDIRWFGADHFVDLSASAQLLAYFLPGLAPPEEDLYVMINGSEKSAAFGIFVGDPAQWQVQINTADGQCSSSSRPAVDILENRITVAPHSTIVLTRSQTAA